jgi:formylglycine-generating enzyme required for sulfatase activity
MKAINDFGKSEKQSRRLSTGMGCSQSMGAMALTLLLGVACQGVNGEDQASVALRMVPEITVTGVNNTAYIVQSVEQLGNTNDWTTLANFVITNSSYAVYDSTPGTGKRFYRAISLGDQPVGTNNMVWIKPGTFLMGLSDSDTENFDAEKPASTVTLSNGFWMGKYEVTQDEYQSVMGNNPSSFTDSINLPVDSVSWMNASNYCVRLTDAARAAKTLPTGYVYRLPTEAEWEYAARSGSTNRFSFGIDANYTTVLQYGWIEANASGATHPVGLKLPNVWGLYDMVGNVGEWCSDWYAFDTYTAAPKTNPAGPAQGTDKVYRGGSISDTAVSCRSSARSGMAPDFPGLNSFGFRVVLAKP